MNPDERPKLGEVENVLRSVLDKEISKNGIIQPIQESVERRDQHG
jgi:hypothetical protein